MVGIVSFLTRSNINIAIVSMIPVKDISANSSEVDLCPNLGSGTNETEAVTHGEVFDWSPQLQGSVLGCFFWTYFLFQGPSGYINGRYGGRIPVSLSLLVGGIISTLGPVLAHASVYLLIISRMVMGVFQAAVFPGIFVLAITWFPPQERSMALALNEIGGSIGTILLFFTSGFLVQEYTWTSLFYFPAIVSFIAFLMFAFFVRSQPEDHPFISEEELAHIRGKKNTMSSSDLEMRGTDGQTYDDDVSMASSYEEEVVEEKVQYAVPWRKMLTNKAVLSLFLFKLSRTMLFHLINTKIPFYLKHVLKEDIVSVGIIYGLFTGILFACVLVSAKLSDMIISRGWLSRTNCRRFFSLFSGTGSAIAFMLVPALRCRGVLIKVFFYFIAVGQGLAMASDVTIPPEMTGNFSAILYALCNMCHVIPGFVSPMFAGFVLGIEEDEWVAWDIIFNTIGAFCIFSNIIFIIFIRAERQDFDHVEQNTPHRDMRAMSIVSGISNYDPY